jgi:benzoyl-CoA 2,3-dioxygenase component B
MNGGVITREDAPALSALNMRLRDDYINDCENGIGRWNKAIEKFGIAFELRLPHVAFHRHIGEFAGVHADMGGNILDDAAWTSRQAELLPSGEDRDYVESLMQPETEAGKFARWIAPPKVGIDNKSGDFEYVKIA